jgi:outer membrane receptor protein involved in Fe transport
MKQYTMNNIASKPLLAVGFVVAATAIGVRPADAQNDAPHANDIEVPSVILETSDGVTATQESSEIDLANVVQSAAKGVTTVQEAPAIVTVVTSDEIRDRQFVTIQQLVDTVPGWTRASLLHNNLDTPLVRGQAQAVQFLHDSLSLFDPYINSSTIHRGQPMELIKRVEMITGPGGVLWGSNSLLGILNIITKDADDVDGLETGARFGGGLGDRQSAHAYAMYGNPNLLNGKLKLFAHASVDSYKGFGMQLPLLLSQQSAPQPNGSSAYGPLVTSDPARSLIFNLNGKLSFGKLQFRVAYPFGSKQQNAGLSGNPVRNTIEGDAECSSATPPAQGCIDPLKTSRELRADYFDRYAVAEYRTRFASGKSGITAKAYVAQFARSFAPLQILAPTASVIGGANFSVDNTSYRSGANIDGDITISDKVRIQYGLEGFAEWKIDNTKNAIGVGTEATFTGPQPLTRLPVLCPRRYNVATGTNDLIEGCPLVFAFAASRTVFGAYLNPQWRPSKKLILDAGARLQAAPAALGKLSYPVNATLAATVVWNFIPSWFAKLNYAQGFRPPAFNNAAGNGAAVQFNAPASLNVETSDATQFEVNARIYKGDRRIRELSFRADAAYTRLNNLIQIQSGQYKNTGDRVLTSGELLAKLYVQGGHRLELSYSYLQGTSGDKGKLRYMPEHWFNLAGVWNLLDGKLTATTNLRVAGAAEDANRLVEYRDNTGGSMGSVTKSVEVQTTDLVLDRLPPLAEVSFGLTWSPVDKLAINATVYNAMKSHGYQPDAFFDYEPRLEYLPNPYEGFRAYLSAAYSY